MARKKKSSFAATERINKGGGYGRGYHGAHHIEHVNARGSYMAPTKRVLAEYVMAASDEEFLEAVEYNPKIIWDCARIYRYGIYHNEMIKRAVDLVNREIYDLASIEYRIGLANTVKKFKDLYAWRGDDNEEIV